jgi:alkaline phosphatase
MSPRPRNASLALVLRASSFIAACLCSTTVAWAETRIRIMPPDRTTVAVGQRFDLRVEATTVGTLSSPPPPGLVVSVDGVDVTGRNVLEPGEGGQRGVGGTGRESDGQPLIAPGPGNSTNLLVEGFTFERAGVHTIAARTADGASVRVEVTAVAWRQRRAGVPRAKNIILFLGDGMGAAHRTAARILARGVSSGKASGALAMDRLPVTGQVMTFSLNSVITDSAPGMSAYVTGSKGNNNQEGVYPDNTSFAFDNPRIEYLGELLRRTRGPGFNVGIVTTADVTDATPGANVVHTAARSAGLEIARRFFDERATNAVTVLLGGGRAQFLPEAKGGSRTDDRNLVDEYVAAGYRYVATSTELAALGSTPTPPKALLGLFHRSHMSVAFDKVGAGRYSSELPTDPTSPLRQQPMLDDMTRAALRTLGRSRDGFYLLVEGASIDKQAHNADAERAIWDTIEMDNAVAAALEFAERTNGDTDPSNDTLVVVTADHECGGLSIVGVGNERYAPKTLGRAVRDYAAVFRFGAEQQLDFVPNYRPDEKGFPLDPDPSRKVLLGWGAAPDRYENWVSNRRALAPAYDPIVIDGDTPTHKAIADPRRDGPDPASDSATVEGQRVEGFLVPGVIENGEHACPDANPCPADTSSVPHTIAGHTATDVPLSAYGPGMWQFTGTFENTDVFFKLLRAATGSYPPPGRGSRLAP